MGLCNCHSYPVFNQFWPFGQDYAHWAMSYRSSHFISLSFAEMTLTTYQGCRTWFSLDSPWFQISVLQFPFSSHSSRRLPSWSRDAFPRQQWAMLARWYSSGCPSVDFEQSCWLRTSCQPSPHCYFSAKCHCFSFYFIELVICIVLGWALLKTFFFDLVCFELHSSWMISVTAWFSWGPLLYLTRSFCCHNWFHLPPMIFFDKEYTPYI